MTENERFEICGEGSTNIDVTTYIVEYGDGDDDCFELYESKEDSQKVCDKINNILDENEQLKHECNYLQNRLDDFINIQNENEQLKQQLSSINQLIDNKIDEFKNGDYGDLPCNTIHMFLDLKQEIGDVE